MTHLLTAESTHLLRQHPLDVGPSLVARTQLELPREQRPAVHELGHVLRLDGVRVQHPLRLRVEVGPVHEPEVVVVDREGRRGVRVAERRLEEALVGDAELGKVRLDVVLFYFGGGGRVRGRCHAVCLHNK